MLAHRTLSVRNRFTGRDFDFIASVLASGEQRLHLAKLWQDPDARCELLDLKEVLRGLLETPAALQVSARFYFYVIVRHALRRNGLADVRLAEYVAEVMAKRITAAPEDRLHDAASGYTRVADFCSLISLARGRMKFHLQVAAGDQFLILTGLYPGFLKRRQEQEPDAGMVFYESFAQKAFRGAASSIHARTSSAHGAYGVIAETFPQVRQSLNEMVEDLVFLGE